MSARWYDANLNPKYAYRHCDRRGFITDGRGHAFHFHGGTKPKEIESLVAYLDDLETEIERLGGTIPEMKR